MDTTSITLAYVLWEVSRRPDIQQRLHAELDLVMPNSRTIPDISTLYKLPFLTAVVKEGLLNHLAFLPKIGPEEIQQH